MADTITNIPGKDIKLVDNGDGTYSFSVALNDGVTLKTGDIQIGAMEIKDAITENRAEIGSDGSFKTKIASGDNVVDVTDDGSLTVLATDIISGTATDGSQATLVDANKEFITNMLTDAIIELDIGTKKYFRKIISNTIDTITFPAIAGASASAVVGSSEAGQVTIVYDLQGVGGNEYTVEFVKSSGNDMALSSSVTDLVLTVYLGTDVNSDLDAGKNTATAIAESISQIPNFTATMTGSGGAMIETVEPVEFAGGIAIVSASNGVNYKVRSNKNALGSKTDLRATDEDASELTVISLLRAIMGYLKAISQA